LIVREEGEKILLESVPPNAIVTPLPDDHDPQKQEPYVPIGKQEMGADEEPVEKTIALDVRAASKDVYPGWTIPDGDENTGDGGQRAIEAQLAAAVTGRKPLYFDPWGEQFSDAFAQAYRKVLPTDVEVVSRDGMLFVFRPEAVTPILDSDPEFYRHAGESVIDSISRVSGQGMNGELLGYGARHMLETPSHEVRIFKGDELVLYFFISNHNENIAEKIAGERANDFVRAFGWTDVSFRLTKRG
jgi:hypothetical protein